MKRVTSGRAGGLALLIVVATAGCEPSAAEALVGPAPPPVEVRSGIDKAVATTGDLLTYEVVVEHDAGVAIEVPDPGDQIAGFRIVDMGTDPPAERQGRVTERRWYALRADLVGSYILPPATVSFTKPPATPDGEPTSETLTTSEIFVEVQTVLPQDGSATDIRGLKPLEPIPAEIPWLWIALGAGLLLTAAAIGVVIWVRRRGEKIEPPVPPHEIAFAALGALRQTDFDDREALRVYYFKISEVLRTYVEGRFTLNATDLTSEEILARLDEVAGLRPKPRQKLEGFLVHTDLVKFADLAPTTAEIGETYEQALSFVEETVPPAVAAVLPSGAAASGRGASA